MEDSDKNFHYFSGYSGIGCLIIPKKSTPFLVAPMMELERAKKTSKVKVYEWVKGKKLFELIKEILTKKRLRPKTIGIVKDAFSLTVYAALKKHIKKIKILDISLDCLKLRAIKTTHEIEMTSKSAKITSRIINECINKFSTFTTEKDVEKFLHIETIKSGCTLAFPPIVASGKTGSMPHSKPRNIKIQKGFCVIDFGVVYNGYHSDITRTIYVGEPKKEEIKLYNLLKSTQATLIRNVSLNMKCSDLYDQTLDLLGEYAEKFTHGLGHGIGLQIHELPNLKPISDEILKNNMIFTIEPGIYFEGKFGIRIEDDILLRNGKIEILTKVTKKLIKVQK